MEIDAVGDDVTFVKVVRRMKQPTSETPLAADLTSPPTIRELTAAGLNPGGYTEDYFKPKKDKQSRKFSHFELPTGLRTAPRDTDGKFKLEQQILGGPMKETFEFQYHDDVTLDTTHSTFDGRPARESRLEDAPPLGPKDTKDLLDVEMLKEFGMCAERRRDFLFFSLLLLPIADFEFKNGFVLQGFWDKIARFTQLYEIDERPYGIGGGQNRRYGPRDVRKCINFMGVALHNGALGGRTPSRRYEKFIPIPPGVCPMTGWCTDAPPGMMRNPLYSELLHQGMAQDEFNYTRRVFKANSNHATTATKGHDDYRPSHKYDLPWYTARNNTVSLTKEGTASLVVNSDEETGSVTHKAGGETVKPIKNKPGASKGVQNNLGLGCEEGHKRLYHYLSRHAKNPRLVTYQGCNEIA